MITIRPGQKSVFSKILMSTMPILFAGAITYFACYALYVRAAADAAELLDTAHRIHLMLVAMEREESAFILDDLTKATFYRTGGSEHADASEGYRVDARAMSYALAPRFPQKKTAAEKLTAMLDDHGDKFDRMRRLFQKRGFNDEGFEAMWRRELDELGFELRKSGAPDLATRVLQVKIDALEYLNSDRYELAEIVSARLNELQGQLEARKISKGARLRQTLSEAKSHFETYVAIERELGLSGEAGLRGQVKGDFETLEKIAIDIAEEAARSSKEEQNHFETLTLLVLALIFIGEMLALYFAARSISRPLRELEDAMVRVRSGDRSAQFDVHTGDEIESLATEFKTLVTSLDQSEQQVIQAQKIDAVGTLAGGIAHDFNNILAGMLVYVEILKRRHKSDLTTVTDLTVIETSAQRAVELTRQILDFSRQKVMSKSAVNIRQLFNEISNLLERTFPSTISISTRVPPNLADAFGNSGQLMQILMNLGVNARDAMPKGGRISFEAIDVTIDEKLGESSLKPGKYIKIIVADTGTGIPKDILPKIFDPFFTTKDVGNGTGLGLSTVHGIVKSHDGLIDVVSSATHGTRFIVYIPQAASVMRVSTTRLDGKMIMIIAEDRELGVTIHTALADEGATVLEAPKDEDSHDFFEINKTLLNAVVFSGSERAGWVQENFDQIQVVTCDLPSHIEGMIHALANPVVRDRQAS